MRLPAGFWCSPLEDTDIDAVVRLVNACEAHDSGVQMYERADLVADLRSQGMDRRRDVVVVRASGRGEGNVVAWGMVLRGRSRWADVHPGFRHRGIGRAIIDWSVARASEIGADRIGQTVEDRRTDAVELFRLAGAQPVRTAWILSRDADAPQARRGPPGSSGGVLVRDSTPADERAALEVMEQAFAQWPDRPPSALATWEAMTTRREGFSSDQLQVAVGEGQRVVGAAFLIDDGTELWVDKLGTRPDMAGRGIGRALLERAFALTRDRGRARTCLSTDSTTGALSFYEHAGMAVTRSFTHWAIPLDRRGTG